MSDIYFYITSKYIYIYYIYIIKIGEKRKEREKALMT